MANASTPYVEIWRLFIDECHTKINDFYEIDDFIQLNQFLSDIPAQPEITF